MGNLVIDAGQTGTRSEFFAVGTPVDSRAWPGIRAHDDVLVQLAQIIAEALDDVAETSSISVSVGISGLGPSHGGAERLLQLCPPSVTTIALAHDSVTAYLGAMRDGEGAVLAVGTGVVVTACVGTATTRVDGWGHLLGDDGGGFWIGLSGLRAAMRSADGRGPATDLSARARERFAEPVELPKLIYEDPDRVAAIASFCTDVVACAEAGDTIAAEIVNHAARELAHSASAALDALDARPSQRRASWSGTLITASLYMRDCVRQALAAEPHPIDLVSPVGVPLDGARMLIDLSPDHPLFGAISRATRNER
jgi:N-acetylglucosamine kinase-like BadF-type ATPase